MLCQPAAKGKAAGAGPKLAYPAKAEYGA